jgi:hypothetical protein
MPKIETSVYHVTGFRQQEVMVQVHVPVDQAREMIKNMVRLMDYPNPGSNTICLTMWCNHGFPERYTGPRPSEKMVDRSDKKG